MALIVRRSVKGSRLTVPEIDDHLDYLDLLSPNVKTISNGIITVTGPGVYYLLPESGTADDLTQINGALGHEEPIILRANTVGHVITVINTPPGLRLATSTLLLNSIYDHLELRSRAVNVWVIHSHISVPP